MTLPITVITLFPEMFPGPLSYSLIGRALEEERFTLNTINLRDYGLGKHRQVDDTPYGGGSGLVLRPDVVSGALTAAFENNPDALLIHFSPRGIPLTQPLIAELAGTHAPHISLVDKATADERRIAERSESQRRPLILLCGRFEAVDERILNHYQPLEISLGDFVMTGGELAAMALIDATVRLLDGVIGDAESLSQESFGMSEDYACLLEYPHYTKPPEWKGKNVPEALLSGHHAQIEAWRKQQAEQVTKARRPDLWERYTKKSS